jgi:hypothetical protein
MLGVEHDAGAIRATIVVGEALCIKKFSLPPLEADFRQP